MMKILLVANMYPSKKYPHYGVFVKNSEDILCSMNDVIIKRLTMGKIDNKGIRLFAYILLYSKIILYACFGNYDVIYGHFLSHIAIPILIVRKFNKRIKIIVNVHGNDVVPDRNKDLKWLKWVRKALCKITHVIVPSEYFKQIMISEYNVDEKDISIFPSGGVDRTVFYKRNKNEMIEKFQLDSSKRYIGFISRIEKNKGWDIFLKAIHLLRNQDNLRFIIVGDGDEQHELNNMISELDIEDSIIRFNLLSQKEIAELFNVFDIFCFPTYRKSESLGLVGIEAMACETLVIASDHYGPSTYMKDSINGYTFTSGDADSLYECILKVLNLSDRQKKQICIKAIETVDEYDKNNISDKLISIFERFK